MRLDELRAALRSAVNRAEAAIGEADRTAAESAAAEPEQTDVKDCAAVGAVEDRAEAATEAGPDEFVHYPRSRWLV